MIRTFAFAAVVAPSANAYAQETSSVPLRDEEFLMKAYCEGMAEVAKSKLACEKATRMDNECSQFDYRSGPRGYRLQ